MWWRFRQDAGWADFVSTGRSRISSGSMRRNTWLMERIGDPRTISVTFFADMINRGLTAVVHYSVVWCARKCKIDFLAFSPPTRV